jgi:hypothetical protein
MFGGSSRQARRPFNLSGLDGAQRLPSLVIPANAGMTQGRGTAEGVRRFTAMTGNLPADQGRAPHLYDEQLQRQQQEKRLLRERAEGRPDLLNLPPHR